MNTALGDSFDIGWKLAAVLLGCGGEHLLTSYEVERKPVAVRNIDHSGVHWSVHSTCWRWITNGGREHVTALSAEGNELPSKINEYLYRFDGENEDLGIELGYRYNWSPVVAPVKEVLETPWNERQYIPSTWPGARAPHVYLQGGKMSIFDLFGNDYTLVECSFDVSFVKMFADAAKKLAIPLKTVHLPKERHTGNLEA